MDHRIHIRVFLLAGMKHQKICNLYRHPYRIMQLLIGDGRNRSIKPAQSRKAILICKRTYLPENQSGHRCAVYIVVFLHRFPVCRDRLIRYCKSLRRELVHFCLHFRRELLFCFFLPIRRHSLFLIHFHSLNPPIISDALSRAVSEAGRLYCYVSNRNIPHSAWEITDFSRMQTPPGSPPAARRFGFTYSLPGSRRTTYGSGSRQHIRLKASGAHSRTALSLGGSLRRK